MSITVRSGKRGITIKASGASAQALFMAMTRNLEGKGPTDAPNPVPNRPKPGAQGDGATAPENACNGMEGNPA